MFALSARPTAALCDETGLVLSNSEPTFSAKPIPALDLTDSVTLEAWVKAAPMSDAGGRILDKTLPNSQVGYMLDTYPGNSLRMITEFGQCRYDAHLTSDHWTYVVGVYSASQKIMRLYVDGKAVPVQYVTNGFPQTADSSKLPFPAMTPSPAPLMVGSDPQGGSRFQGSILRASVIAAPLSADEIARRFQAGPTAAPQTDSVLGSWYFGGTLGRTLKPLIGTIVLKRSGTETLTGEASAPSEPLSLWYREPSSQWIEALPIGNGKIGAMVFGGISTERIALNDGTLWSGEPQDGNPKHDPDLLAKVRDAVFRGDYGEADRLAPGFQGPWTQTYLPLGNLNIEFDLSNSAIENYRRDLNLTSGVATTEFTQDGITYVRKAFVSYPDHVLVYQITASKPGALNFVLSLDSPLRSAMGTRGNDMCVLTGQAPSNVEPHYSNRLPNPIQDSINGRSVGMKFQADALVSATSGKVASDDQGVHIEGATSATILVSTGTGFNGFDKSPTLEGRNPAELADSQIQAASKKTYGELLTAHLQDFQTKFDRVELNVGSATTANLPTDERLKQFRTTDDPQFAALVFQFGRYLLLSCSREGGQPATLQGIWNEAVRPPWSSNYTINVNTEMNYWPAEVCNLPETFAPVPPWMHGLAINGARTASEDYGLPGWCAHHNSDLWAVTWPVGSGNGWPGYANWPMGGAWMCESLWEHYAFSQDKTYLRKVAYPIMRGAAEFCLAWLVPDGKGHLVTNPSTSPEHSFHDAAGKDHAVSMASTMDISLTRDLFNHCIAASEVLGEDAAFADSLKQALAKLYPYQVNSAGRLQEWFQDFTPGEVHHRHLSFLVGLYPGDEIDEYKTPDIYAAAEKALEYRGDSGTGWSLAWKISLWARLHDGDHGYLFVRDLLSLQGTEFNGGAGLCPNLFDSCPPFQIDGNFGYTAGIAEMLLQSNNDCLQFLPALPLKWPTGYVTGLRARGGFTVSESWQDHNLVKATIRSIAGSDCNIRSKIALDVFDVTGAKKRIKEHSNGSGQIKFETIQGHLYEVRPL